MGHGNEYSSKHVAFFARVCIFWMNDWVKQWVTELKKRRGKVHGISDKFRSLVLSGLATDEGTGRITWDGMKKSWASGSCSLPWSKRWARETPGSEWGTGASEDSEGLCHWRSITSPRFKALQTSLHLWCSRNSWIPGAALFPSAHRLWESESVAIKK